MGYSCEHNIGNGHASRPGNIAGKETASKDLYFSVTIIELLTCHESSYIAFMLSDQVEAMKELSCNKLGSLTEAMLSC
jgi:hypothetical protein